MNIKKIIKILKQISIFLLISILLSFPTCFLIGFAFPVNFEQVRTKNFFVPKEQLWSVLTEIEAYPVWKPGILDVTVSDENSTDLYPLYWVEYDEASRKRKWDVKEWSYLEKLAIENSPSKRFKENISFTLREDDGSIHLAIKILGEYTNPFQRFTQRFVHNHKDFLDAVLIGIDEQIKRQDNEL